MKTCIFNSGFSSGFFYQTRGIRQGCYCSSSLFILAVELLAIQVWKSTLIQGIQVAGQEIEMSPYADDSTFFVHGIPALQHLLRILFHLVRASYQLPEIAPALIGQSPSSPYFKDVMTEELQYLLNFEPKLKQIQNICSMWLNRSLSSKKKR